MKQKEVIHNKFIESNLESIKVLRIGSKNKEKTKEK
jgi:hypothetical protein